MRLTVNLSKVELKKSKEDVTGKMGASWISHSMEHFGVKKVVADEYRNKKMSNREINAYDKIMSGAMMMISGGERAEDIEALRADEGLKNSLGWDNIIGADTLLNFIGSKRSNARNRRINNAMIIKSMKKSEEAGFTYDNDATYFDSEKKRAEYSYKKTKQFSGLIGCIGELGLINTVEYRRGNISPKTGILNQLKKAVYQAEKAGKRISVFRSDSAAYQTKILTFCDMKGIKYYISADKKEGMRKKIRELRNYEWKTMYGRYKDQHDTQWAETAYVISKGFRIRILILRWKNPEPDLFSEEYCYHVIATNNKDVAAMEWLKIHNGRMGTIEHINKDIKLGMGCSYTPSHEFEKNRGYFLLGVMAYNMVQIIKLFYLNVSTKKWTLKTLRYRFINVCGKIVKTGRKFYCKIINVTNEIFELFRYFKARLSIATR